MSKALDLLSKGIQKGFQAIEEHDIEKGRRWREQQEREEEKRERKREYLRSVSAMSPEELRRYGLDPDNMTDEELDNWGNNNQPSFDLSDAEIASVLTSHYEQEVFRAKQIAEDIAEFSMDIPDSEILKYIENAQTIINNPQTILNRYPNKFESEILYNRCVKELGKSRAENWGTYDFKKLKKIIIKAWEKRLDKLIAHAISRKDYLTPAQNARLSMYEQKYEEQQKRKKERYQKEKECRLKRQEEEKKQWKKEEAEMRKKEAVVAHQMKYHKLVACGFWVAWAVAFILLFVEMEEWYEYAMTSVICVVTAIALLLYTFSSRIIHRNIALVLWIGWTILMFYAIYDAEWWGYVLAMLIGGIVAIPLFFYQITCGEFMVTTKAHVEDKDDMKAAKSLTEEQKSDVDAYIAFLNSQRKEELDDSGLFNEEMLDDIFGSDTDDKED